MFCRKTSIFARLFPCLGHENYQNTPARHSFYPKYSRCHHPRGRLCHIRRYQRRSCLRAPHTHRGAGAFHVPERSHGPIHQHGTLFDRAGRHDPDPLQQHSPTPFAQRRSFRRIHCHECPFDIGYYFADQADASSNLSTT